MTTKKVLRCGTVFPGCNFVSHGESEAEVLAKIAEHARQAHDMTHLSNALRARIVAQMETEGGEKGKH